ncbi:glycosyltransferase family 9 protein [Parabacteroides sp. Marseille-P3160]|uniref:glycosyltransferase family 9 protein n=1 Tax=Parabacteroides sp. Marseille-P3160 TaxID=1917887 RepID=UPI0009B9B638|nr:glycosyltransferase family 9 protein [Parabacteroides sp. Marseille-P3160]
MANVLVIRLSAIGDVAMTIPVIYSAAKANPQDSFTVLTQSFLMPIFLHRPSNVNIIGINTKTSEKTLCGLLRFATAFSRYDYDLVLDLHNVIRTKIIRTFFQWRKRPVYVLDKARKEREALTRMYHKKLKPLPLMTERYADVFRKGGLKYEDTFRTLFSEEKPDRKALESIAGVKQEPWVGIAPFAKHRGKIYPLEAMEEVVAVLSKKKHFRLFLFGGRGKEEEMLARWEAKYPHVKSMVGICSLDQELMLISRLDVLLCMDSANMHFASLVGTPVLSIWGATHPYSGFYGYHQDLENAIQLDLPCRPCSIYGEKKCYRGDWACMTQILPMDVVKRVEAFLQKQQTDRDENHYKS